MSISRCDIISSVPQSVLAPQSKGQLALRPGRSVRGKTAASRRSGVPALPAGATCAVKVTANGVTDTDPTDPLDTIAPDFNFSFTTASPADTAPSVARDPCKWCTEVPVDSSIVIIRTVIVRRQVLVLQAPSRCSIPGNRPVRRFEVYA